MTREIDGKLYYMKGDGSLIPEDQVKDTDKLRDQFVMSLAEKMLDLKSEMIKVKAEVLDDIDAFMETMGEQYGVTMGGAKGNLTWTSYDGNVRIQYYNNDSLTFNEGIHVAKQLIDDFLNDITKDSSSTIKQIVNAAFSFKQGRMDVKAILKLREINEKDLRWQKAMSIIDESKQWIPGNKSLRLYIKNKLTGSLEPCDMDFTKLMGEIRTTAPSPAPVDNNEVMDGAAV